MQEKKRKRKARKKQRNNYKTKRGKDPGTSNKEGTLWEEWVDPENEGLAGISESPVHTAL